MPERIQMRRTKGWRKPAGAVYVGRPTKWGNPFTVEMGLRLGKTEPEARSSAVRMFEVWIRRPSVPCHGKQHAEIHADLAELRGKDLACWCRLDQPCHADVLLELANGDRA